MFHGLTIRVLLVTELLAPKSKKSSQRSDRHASPRDAKQQQQQYKARDALGAYIARPESYPSSVVVYYNDDVVAIRDLFPKSAVHLLLLPRDPGKSLAHPFDAFEDAEFLVRIRAEAKHLRSLAASELRRLFGKSSALEKARQAALDAEEEEQEEQAAAAAAAPSVSDELPAGRDWEKEVMCGVHAHPSMNHLHVHVISVDRAGDCLKHRNHYNSFSTPFFIDIEDFPLSADDVRRHPGSQGYLQRSLVCWRCNRDFGNRFKELKEHLREEFNEWKKE